MQAMTLALPLQIHHLSTSLLYTRLSLWAQVIAMDGMYAGFAGAKTGHRRMTLNRWTSAAADPPPSVCNAANTVAGTEPVADYRKPAQSLRVQP